MNFVLHHFLATRDLPRAGAAVGAMLPDVWRMAERAARPASATVTSDDPRVAAVLEGIAHHARADHAFHACAPFLAGERVLAADLATLRVPKLAIFAHVACELALDGALLRREGAARVVASVRVDVERALADDALDVAARLHHAARGRAVPPALSTRVARILREIARGPWIAGYATGDGLAARLEGVRTRLGLAALDAPSRAALVDVLEGALVRADAAIDDVLELSV